MLKRYVLIVMAGIAGLGCFANEEADDVKELQEVTVTAELHKQNASTETFIITDSIRGLASSAALMLGHLPGFEVDWISENVSIGRDRNVPIIVNGKEVDASYAKSLNPKRIKLVEVQRYPPGKYSSYPILINIVLFENYLGWDFSANGMGQVNMTHKPNNSEGVNANYTYSVDKWNFYGTAGVDHKKNYSSNGYVRDIEGVAHEETEMPNADHPNSKFEIGAGALSLGVDRKLGRDHNLSAQVWLHHQNSDSYTKYLINNAMRQRRSMDGKSTNAIGSLFYQGSVNDKVYLWSQLQYTYSNNKDNRGVVDDGISTQSLVDGRKDYVYAFAGVAYVFDPRCYAGVNYAFSWRKTVNKQNIVAPEFFYKENRNKVDAYVQYNPSRKFSLQVQGAMLNTHTSQSGISVSNTSFIPSVNLYWKPLKWLYLKAFYFKSVQYPSTDELSSSWVVDDHMVQMGNPDLKANIMHYAQTKITFFDLMTFDFMWKRSSREINTWYELLPDGMVVRTFNNGEYLHYYIGVSLFKNFVNGFNVHVLGAIEPYKRWSTDGTHRGMSSQLYASGTWTMPKVGLSLRCVYQFYYRKDPLVQGRSYRDYESLNFSVMYPFLKGRMPVSLQFKVPTRLLSKDNYQKIRIPGFSYDTYTDNRMDECRVMLNIRYSIGKGKPQKRNNSYANDTEK